MIFLSWCCWWLHDGRSSLQIFLVHLATFRSWRSNQILTQWSGNVNPKCRGKDRYILTHPYPAEAVKAADLRFVYSLLPYIRFLITLRVIPTKENASMIASNTGTKSVDEAIASMNNPEVHHIVDKLSHFRLAVAVTHIHSDRILWSHDQFR